jgi:glycolate oxidase iron-sulfur subunit
MQTHLADFIKDTPEGQEAESVLRRCVHCGFCTATCPTYQLLGDELDGPRGRIYLIKQLLEGRDVTAKTQQHLDRCLTCRNCESTCPSGVEYGKLVDIGRKLVDDRVPRPLGQRLLRKALAYTLTQPALFNPAYKLGQRLRPLLPASLRNKVLPAQDAGAWPTRHHARKMLLLEGCVQPAMLPNINRATARVLDALEIELIRAPKAGCCGAVRYHLNDHDGGLADMRRNIDAWWPYVEQGVEAIVLNASGCGVMVKEYGHKLRLDPVYAARAERISALARDLSEIVPAQASRLKAKLSGRTIQQVAYHPPCTLQHGQQLRGQVERLLSELGFTVMLPADSHLCCGSAGTYSVLQPKLAYQLRDNKLANLAKLQPELIVSGNVGCIAHLQSGAATPVSHWIELVDRVLA